MFSYYRFDSSVFICSSKEGINGAFLSSIPLSLSLSLKPKYNPKANATIINTITIPISTFFLLDFLGLF